ncbi:MAG: radical SAM protein [bacterium]|nr:radical SAM protein [bacterium]
MDGRPLFEPQALYVERGAERYPLGETLVRRYLGRGVPVHWVDDHNRIPELRAWPDRTLPQKKRLLILGVRKTIRLVPNRLSADYILPFTSSGCPAMCVYCYLLCTFFTNSYLRVFVNRDEIWRAVDRKEAHTDRDIVVEIGSNSDLVLEDTLTGSLQWAIDRFSGLRRLQGTLATKFAAVEPLLALDHRRRTRLRVSVNPEPIVRRLEVGTAPLDRRLEAARMLHQAGYPVGVNLAPVVLEDGWERDYGQLLDRLEAELPESLKRTLFFEIIFMTYGVANCRLWAEVSPRIRQPYDPARMRPKGRGKYAYRPEVRGPAEAFFRRELKRRFPQAILTYVC